MPIKYFHNRFGLEFPIRKVRVAPLPNPAPIVRPPEPLSPPRT